ncbi:hypothetical protein B4907_12600 [Yersinia kristensenii]|nr:hypothetical protein B4907_12600 [Yersinia kristensenii]PEH53623.1 hypothetical protein CRM81_09975 [Yersinia kristensenii]
MKEGRKLAFNDILSSYVVFLPEIVLNLRLVAYFRHRVESDEKLWDDYTRHTSSCMCVGCLRSLQSLTCVSS